MKNLFLFILCSFLVLNCSQDDSELQITKNDKIETRKKKVDCEPKFMEGSAIDIFGSAYVGGFDQGWKGAFESELFPCPEYTTAGNCCPGVVELQFDIYPPFSTTCNSVLSVEEQQALFDEIKAIGAANSIPCPDGPYVMVPVAYDIVYDAVLCCPFGGNPPCVDPFVDPCECYDEFPDDEYWGCCQSYILHLYIKFAYSGECLSHFEG